MKNIKNRCFLFLYFMFIITACTQNFETAIIGSWEGVSLKQNFHFYENGNVELNDLKHGVYRGSYKITGDTLECKFERFAFPVVRTVRIKGDKLILIDKNGIEEIYDLSSST